jgi:drug/metabolite transporter (DMT)-like permease
MRNVRLISQYIHLHFIVVLLGFTAILGALISMDAIALVWWRMMIASGGLLGYLLWKRIPMQVNLKQFAHLISIGVLVALHWITFFHAIKVSNVSVTLGVFASTTLFTSFLEPILQNRKIFWLEVLIGMVIIGGIYLIFQYEFQYVEGILYSLLSALLNGLFVVLNRNISRRWHPTVISFYEMIGGFLSISLFYILISGAADKGLFLISIPDLGWILILSLLCTSYAFTAIVQIMKELSAYTVVLSINLEPVYGIFLAFLFFGEAETMSSGFYAGTLLILISVFSFPFLKRKFAHKELRK